MVLEMHSSAGAFLEGWRGLGGRWGFAGDAGDAGGGGGVKERCGVEDWGLLLAAVA